MVEYKIIGDTDMHIIDWLLLLICFILFFPIKYLYLYVDGVEEIRQKVFEKKHVDKFLNSINR